MLTRRALIVRGGAAGAGVVFLWPGRAEAAAGPVLATTKSIPLGGGRIIKGKYVITQPKKGVYRCFSAKCTHQGCAVASVSRGTINCPCHGSKFSASTGAVVQGPAKRPLARKKIKVAKGKISLA
ncbi:Rieske-like 2Fe-2S protein [Nonomuraea polychroma]|uniref:Cytochrome bc1 complex Rieske iron-sulfur subunit n=1 Tax=Nonomuraea polychroma TaxID=46176 RepID=A0A438MK93_9ACTN|nr:Rieske (2Fe-2S) protein [Nonomuraea polychroma]RVX46143.1 Rieske-like 2Fe-2S protein [Nonomuraea polychroma]